MQRDEDRIRDMAERQRRRDLRFHREGRELLAIRSRGLWLRAYPDKYKDRPGDFIDYVLSLGGPLQSRSTILRRLTLAEHFTARQYKQSIGQGICPSALEVIADAPRELRSDLLELAPLHTVEDLRKAAATGRAQLIKAQQAQDPDAVKLAMLKAAQKEKQRREQARQGVCPTCAGTAPAHKPAAPEPPAQKDPPPQRRSDRRENGPREEAPPPNTPPSPPSELAALKEQLAHKDQQLAEAQAQLAALAGKEAALADREAAITVREQQLAAAAAEHEQTALRLRERRIVLDKREKSLDARHEALVHQERLARELYAAARKEAADLALSRAQLDHDQHALADHRALLAHQERMLIELGLKTRAGCFRWNLTPGLSLQASLAYLSDGFHHLHMTAATLFHDQFQRRCERLEPGELDLALEMGHRLGRLHDLARSAFMAIGESYANRYPARFEAELAAFQAKLAAEKAHGSQAQALPASLPENDPARDPAFLIPIAALLGTRRTATSQRGLLGTTADGRGILLGLSRAQMVLISGLQKSGKSYSLLVILEMLVQELDHINTLTHAYAYLFVHFGNGFDDYPCELAVSTQPNRDVRDGERLSKLGARPRGLPEHQVVLVPPMTAAQLEVREREYPGREVRVIQIGRAHLNAARFNALLDAENDEAYYVTWLEKKAKEGRSQFSPEWILSEIDKTTDLDVRSKERARKKVADVLAWFGEPDCLEDMAPGMGYIADMRTDDFGPRQVSNAVAVLMSIVSQKRDGEGKLMPAVICLDEAHKGLNRRTGVSNLTVTLMAEVRHRKAWLLAATQMPEELDGRVRKLPTMLLTHRLEAEASREALVESKAGMEVLTMKDLAELEPGEAWVQMQEVSDPEKQGKPFKMKVRSACAQPGGETVTTAPDEEE